MNASISESHIAVPPGIAACIPVRNEADHIVRCLDAFAAQDIRLPFALSKAN